MSKASVRRYRNVRKIDWDAQPLGLVGDAAIAKLVGCDKATARRARQERNIPPMVAPQIRRVTNANWEAMPWYWSNRSISTVYNFDEHTVAKMRAKLGHPVHESDTSAALGSIEERMNILRSCVLNAVFDKQPSYFCDVYERVVYNYGPISYDRVGALLAEFIISGDVKISFRDEDRRREYTRAYPQKAC